MLTTKLRVETFISSLWSHRADACGIQVLFLFAAQILILATCLLAVSLALSFVMKNEANPNMGYIEWNEFVNSFLMKGRVHVVRVSKDHNVIQVMLHPIDDTEGLDSKKVGPLQQVCYLTLYDRIVALYLLESLPRESSIYLY